MVLPRIAEMGADAETAEPASIQATLADREHNATGFRMYLGEAGDAIKDMKRI
jgi:hypothetical protein